MSNASQSARGKPAASSGASSEAKNQCAQARVPYDDGDPNREVQQAILDRLAHGDKVIATCQLVGIDKSVLYRWIANDPIFEKAYREAQAEAADLYAEKPEEVVAELGDKSKGNATHEKIGVAKLAVDVFKWRAGVLNPGKYGPKAQVEHSGKDGKPIDVQIEVVFGK